MLYALNSAVINADYSGRDAILLIQNDALFGLGHAALAVQNNKGGWYYFSVSYKDFKMATK